MKRFAEHIKSHLSKKHMILALAVIITVTAIMVINIKKGDMDVEFRVLSDAEVPQDIKTQVIPEYRDLERALACVLEDNIYVVVTRGEKPTSGYEISIESMEIEDDEGHKTLIVTAFFKDPEPGDSLAQILTYPLEVAETDLSELPDSIELRARY